MYEIRNEKNLVRQKHKKIRNSIPDDKRAEYDEKICNKIMSLVSYRFAETVLLYARVNSEIDVSRIAESALAAGKRVAYPRCIPGTTEMEFHYISSLDELSPGAMNIPEPSSSALLFDPRSVNGKDKCLCVIPALAFDKRGYRIGYGKGFYDRYLSRFECNRAGVIYSDLLVEELPNGRFDLKVDFIVSEKGVTMADEN